MEVDSDRKVKNLFASEEIDFLNHMLFAMEMDGISKTLNQEKSNLLIIMISRN